MLLFLTPTPAEGPVLPTLVQPAKASLFQEVQNRKDTQKKNGGGTSCSDIYINKPISLPYMNFSKPLFRAALLAGVL